MTIGKIARPKDVWVVAEMPKTRSGKIMRRVLAAISNGMETGRRDHPRGPGRRRRHPPSGRACGR